MRASLDITGETASLRRPTDSGSHTDCHFCTNCGTRLYHAGTNRPGMVTVKGGSLDHAGIIRPVAHIWTASKQYWVVLPEEVPTWEKQPETQEEWMELLTWRN